ncbi:hypothetical protein GMMP1_1040002 [Candidatus Magnetomoraceae bacterium gMMP-1]
MLILPRLWESELSNVPEPEGTGLDGKADRRAGAGTPFYDYIHCTGGDSGFYPKSSKDSL